MIGKEFEGKFLDGAGTVVQPQPTFMDSLNKLDDLSHQDLFEAQKMSQKVFWKIAGQIAPMTVQERYRM